MSELYGRLQRRTKDGKVEVYIADGIHPHLIPYIPRDIRRIRWIDRDYGTSDRLVITIKADALLLKTVFVYARLSQLVPQKQRTFLSSPILSIVNQI